MPANWACELRSVSRPKDHVRGVPFVCHYASQAWRAFVVTMVVVMAMMMNNLMVLG